MIYKAANNCIEGVGGLKWRNRFAATPFGTTLYQALWLLRSFRDLSLYHSTFDVQCEIDLKTVFSRHDQL